MSETLTLEQLKPNALNPRTISKQRKAGLAESIEAHGDLSGVVFNRKTGNLVGGHQRRGILAEKSPITITERVGEGKHKGKKFLDSHGTVALGWIDGGEKFGRHPYREVEWTRGVELRALVAANKHGGEFDSKKTIKVLELIQESPNAKEDLKLTGFEQPELAVLLKQENETKKTKSSVKDLEEKTKGGNLITAEDGKQISSKLKPLQLFFTKEQHEQALAFIKAIQFSNKIEGISDAVFFALQESALKSDSKFSPPEPKKK